MLSELKEFLTQLLPIRRWGQRIKELFSRNRIPVEVKAFTSYLYTQGLSLRKLARILKDLGVQVSHVSIWKWIQRIGQKIQDKLFYKRKRRALVADETKIRTQKGQIWIIAAIDPENREIVGLHVSKHREMIDILQFLNRCLQYCEGKPVLITDGGPWYRWPAQQLGLEHVVLSGGVRSYIERWFKTLKNRLSRFDRYFPTKRTRTPIKEFSA